MRSRVLRILEISTLVAGLALVTFYAAARFDGYFASRAAIESFEASVAKPAPAPLASPAPKPASSTKASLPVAPLAAPASVDFSLWSAGRVRAYRSSLKQHSGHALALLKIPRIHLVVPVFDGTDDLTLNRGVGRIEGTALPGQPGNLGIAGHRDGFFRGLKDVARGDVLELETPNKTETYVIDKIEIVSPKDVGVLAPRPVSSLTLVTCYPFYYFGNAPKRYVVEASLQGEVRNHQQRSNPSRLGALKGETRP